jgi:hypothetical protein
MGVAVKTEWIERYKQDHAREEREAEDRRGRKIERGLLIAYAVSLVGASTLIAMSL